MFRNRDTAQVAFAHEIAQRTRLDSLYISIMASVLVLLWAGVDPIVEPTHGTKFVIYRILVSFIIMSCSGISWLIPTHPFWSAAPQLFSATAIQMMTAVIMAQSTTGYNSYLLGYTCTIYGVGLCVRGHWGYSVAVSGISIFVLAAAQLLSTQPLSLVNTCTAVFFVGTASVLSIAGHFSRYQTSLSEFKSRHAAQMAHDDAMRQREKNSALVAQLEHLSTHDALTNLANRRALDEALDQEITRAQQEGTSLGLVLMDIDHFKELNDSYGHQAGDDVLRLVADRMRESVQKKYFAARYGGEEFVILLPHIDPASVIDIADTIRVNSGISREEGPGREVTLSAGLSIFPSCAPTAASLISAADRALYNAKAGGRNHLRVAPYAQNENDLPLPRSASAR